jgi:hypothetical protein
LTPSSILIYASEISGILKSDQKTILESKCEDIIEKGLSAWLVRLVVARIGSHVEDISLEFLVSQTFITLSSLPDMSSQGISVFQIKLLTLSACFKTFLLFEAVSITTRVQSNVPSAMMLTNYGCH